MNCNERRKADATSGIEGGATGDIPPRGRLNPAAPPTISQHKLPGLTDDAGDSLRSPTVEYSRRLRIRSFLACDNGMATIDPLQGSRIRQDDGDSVVVPKQTLNLHSKVLRSRKPVARVDQDSEHRY